MARERSRAACAEANARAEVRAHLVNMMSRIVVHNRLYDGSL